MNDRGVELRGMYRRANQLIREDIDLIPLEFWIGKKVGFGIPAYKRYASEMAEDT